MHTYATVERTSKDKRKLVLAMGLARPASATTTTRDATCFQIWKVTPNINLWLGTSTSSVSESASSSS